MNWCKQKYVVLFGLMILAFADCSTKRKVASSKPILTETLPVIKATNAERTFRTSAVKYFNIDSTLIDIVPNWNSCTITGSVKHYITTSAFAKLDSIVLDAKSMAIEEVMVNDVATMFKSTKTKLIINLPNAIKANEKATIAIKYIAKPNEKEKGGSASIRNDKGFYFINASGADKYKPTQAWTQGETEANSCWFPTIDKPNHKSTFRVAVTVPDTFTTLGNGVLINSTKLSNALRKDEWYQAKPMSAYLVMLAIGKFSNVPSSKSATFANKLIPINYYVEPRFESNANEIFARTPEMIEFFSDKLGVPFPWDKYSQVVCRDYVSGAMENTSASLFGEFVQHDNRGMIDNDNDYIVAHELFHQWFGDLITCENWSHLTVNESFASYGEYLWIEHLGDKAQMEKVIYGDINRYLKYSESTDYPIVNFYYRDKEDMFSPIVYRKGARVLHLLRHELGDEVFFAGLKHFLTKHSFQAVESDHLRLAMEEISGKDLRWFWEQWFYRGSHPNLELSYSLVNKTDSNTGSYLEVAYKQQCDSNYLFTFPIRFSVKNGADIVTQKFFISKASGVLKIPISVSPLSQITDLVICPDIDNLFIGKITEDILPLQLYNRIIGSESYAQQKRSILALQKLPTAKEFYTKAVQYLLGKNEWQHIQLDIINGIDLNNTAEVQFWKPTLIGIAKSAKHARTISSALNAIATVASGDDKVLFNDKVNHESYMVANAALKGLFKVDTAAALKIVNNQKYNFDELTSTNVQLLTSARIDTCGTYYQEAVAHLFGGKRVEALVNINSLYNAQPSRALLDTYWSILKKCNSDEVEYVTTNALKQTKALALQLVKDSSKASQTTADEIIQYVKQLK
jgi:aminopeptidase N